MWYSFKDMHSGGSRKTDYAEIYIEADSLIIAYAIFEYNFNRDPQNVTRACCGEDYSVMEWSSLEQATGYSRGCRYLYILPDGTPTEEWRTAQEAGVKFGAYYDNEHSTPLDKYIKKPHVLVINKS